MQQITLDLDDPGDASAHLEMTPERKQQLIALMAKAIVAVMRSIREPEHDER